MPNADSHDLKDQPFAAEVREAKAVTQITDSLSLTWPTPVQRKRVLTTGSYTAVQFYHRRKPQEARLNQERTHISSNTCVTITYDNQSRRVHP